MKRLLPLVVALLLVLPLLAVPCFASSVYTFGYIDSSSDESVYVVSGIVPEGNYNLECYADGTLFFSSVAPFALTYTLSDDILTFTDLVTVSVMGEVNEFPLTVIATSSDGYDVTVVVIPADEMANTLSIRFVSVSSDVGIIDGFGAVAAAVIDWVGQIAAAIVEHPLLLVTVGIFFVGGCIALFSRFLSRD